MCLSLKTVVLLLLLLLLLLVVVVVVVVVVVGVSVSHLFSVLSYGRTIHTPMDELKIVFKGPISLPSHFTLKNT
jgi:hypothetical protein